MSATEKKSSLLRLLPEEVTLNEIRSRIFLVPDVRKIEWKNYETQYSSVITSVADGKIPRPRRIVLLNAETLLSMPAYRTGYDFIGTKDGASISLQRNDRPDTDFFKIVFSWALKILNPQSDSTAVPSFIPSFGVALVEPPTPHNVFLFLVKSTALLNSNKTDIPGQWIACGAVDMALGSNPLEPLFARVRSIRINWTPVSIISAFDSYISCYRWSDDDSLVPLMGSSSSQTPDSGSAKDYIMPPATQKSTVLFPRPRSSSTSSSSFGRSFMNDSINSSFPVLLKRLPYVSPVRSMASDARLPSVSFPPIRETPSSSTGEPVRLPSLANLGLTNPNDSFDVSLQQNHRSSLHGKDHV